MFYLHWSEDPSDETSPGDVQRLRMDDTRRRPSSTNKQRWLINISLIKGSKYEFWMADICYSYDLSVSTVRWWMLIAYWTSSDSLQGYPLLVFRLCQEYSGPSERLTSAYCTSDFWICLSAQGMVRVPDPREYAHFLA